MKRKGKIHNQSRHKKRICTPKSYKIMYGKLKKRIAEVRVLTSQKSFGENAGSSPNSGWIPSLISDLFLPFVTSIPLILKQ